MICGRSCTIIIVCPVRAKKPKYKKKKEKEKRSEENTSENKK